MIKRIVCAVQLKQKNHKNKFQSNMMKMNSLVLKIIFLTSQSERGINSGSNGGSFVKFGQKLWKWGEFW